MGCISSKQAAPASGAPALEAYLRPLPGGSRSTRLCRNPHSGLLVKTQNGFGVGEDGDEGPPRCGNGFDFDCGPDSCRRGLRVAPRVVEAELVAAGWPTWLSAAAGEAVHGWVPLRADAYEKLEKIGQGTYSSVFKAREVQTGRMVALKKVHFDNFQPESVKFMAREIAILRKLDHPNILKLEGLITSQLSCSIYLVFEYMEHDLAGLLSSPDINFSEAQIKCYMKQLLAGVEHCHTRGIMHRDIKASNILVNNQGVLKLGDFGLANVLSSKNRHSLTSRVVTLWYRPPELLMGSTDYGVYVDLWSVGCVFAELLTGKPVLKGRTEVEQLHKIFKLCGSPPEEYWKQCRLPLATMFKPQRAYESSLRDRFEDFPLTAVNLVETLLSIEPYNRGTASSALLSEYFTTKPYACEPSSLPKYAPNKEIDAKNRQEARRKKASRARESAAARKPRKSHKASEDPNGVTKQREGVHEISLPIRRLNGRGEAVCAEEMDVSKVDNHFSGPVLIQAVPTSFAWAKRQQNNEDFTSSLSYTMSSTGLLSPVDSNEPISKSSLGASEKESDGTVSSAENTGFGADSNNAVKRVRWKHENQNDVHDSFNTFHVYNPRKEDAATRKNRRYVKPKKGIEFSGPLLSNPGKMDGILEKNERHIRRAIRNPSF